MLHVMLDLETFGTKPGCALRSIGAVAFDLGGGFGGDFYRNIDLRSCDDAGLKIEPDTLLWWERQSSEARAALLDNPINLTGVADAFHRWFTEQGAQFVWSHGANFDEPLWSAACRAIGWHVPWKFWNVRCTRTLFHMADFDTRSIPRQGTHHNALDDAKFQAMCVQRAVALLSRKRAA